jgi:hypothetical protein
VEGATPHRAQVDTRAKVQLFEVVGPNHEGVKLLTSLQVQLHSHPQVAQSETGYFSTSRACSGTICAGSACLVTCTLAV